MRALGRGTCVAGGLLALAMSLANPLSAQENRGRIQGTVAVASTQRPVAGVQVFIPDTNIGTITNEQGQYVLANVPTGQQTVRVQFLGYQSSDQRVTVAAGQTVTANFSMTETAVALDEIIVTGTATQVRRKEVGNSIASISAREIENMPVVNAQEILAGRASGVTFMSNSGQPGAGGTIKIRGINTASQDANPLVYVDGVRIFNDPTRAGWNSHAIVSPLQDIAPEDIERVEVVKGAAATTLYGTEASAGVIQIFTKKGIAGRTTWNAEVSYGGNQASRWASSTDPTNQFVKCGNIDQMYGLVLSGSKKGDHLFFEDPTCPASGTWSRTGASQRYALSVRGGGGLITYSLSGNYGNDDGYLPTMYSRDGGFRANFAFTPFDAFSVSINSAYSRRDSRFAPDGNNAGGFLLNVGRGKDNYMKGGKGDDCINVPKEKVCTTNGYVFDALSTTKSHHYMSGMTLNYTPTDAFSNRFIVGFDYTSMDNTDIRPFGYLTLPEGYYWDEPTDHTKISLDYAGTLTHQFGSSINSSFSFGGQIFRDRHRWTEFDVQSFAGPGEPTLESGAELTYRADRPINVTNAGFFGQELLGINDRLFLTGGLRVDGNSAFGNNYGLQAYPKLSVSYVLSDNAFWPQWFETMKLRAAIGESGKAPGAFDKVRTWSPVSGDDGKPGFTPGDIGNDNVGPERTRESEVGFDASFFKGGLGIEFTAYRARTLKALIPVNYPPSAGFTAARIENVGELLNRGLEGTLSLGVLRTDNVDLRFRLNGSVLSSKALDLDGGKPDTTRIYTGLNSYIKEGDEIPMYYGTRVMNPDELAAPQLVQDTVLGRVYPNKLLGIGTTLTLFRILTLDALGEFQGGHVVQNYTGYQTGRRGDWFPCYATQEKIIAFDKGDANALNGVKAIDRARCAISSRGTAGSTVGYDIGYWAEKGDFFKVRQVSLTWELPSTIVKGFARSARITIAGRNLFTSTSYTGADPESMDGADQFNLVGNAGRFGRRDYYQLPATRSFMLTTRVTF
jgi:TonB-dependent starch-binding outer membrane protein SusC